MKHDPRTSAIIVTIFIIAQLIGLHIVSQYIDIEQSTTTQQTVIYEESYPSYIEPPQVENESYSFVPIVLAILVGTLIVLLIARFKKYGLWKVWFLISVVVALSLAFSPYISKVTNLLNLSTQVSAIVTFLIAAVLAFYKTYRPTPILHNTTEVFIYGGIAALFVPILNMFSAIIILVLISFYDAYAVWKSHHMVKLATFQADAQVFAGLFIPKTVSTHSDVPQPSAKKTKSLNAILGGGDIAFPLLFTGTALKYTGSVSVAIITTIGAAAALGYLLYMSKPNKFYPAMPFITIGTFLGFIIAVI